MRIVICARFLSDTHWSRPVAKPRCPACGSLLAERDMVLCAKCGAVTHGFVCADEHAHDCAGPLGIQLDSERDQERLAAWRKAAAG